MIVIGFAITSFWGYKGKKNPAHFRQQAGTIFIKKS
jgi:hypothetical protein